MPHHFKPGFGGVFASILTAVLFLLATDAKAADQVKVGVFPVSSALPVFSLLLSAAILPNEESNRFRREWLQVP